MIESIAEIEPQVKSAPILVSERAFDNESTTESERARSWEKRQKTLSESIWMRAPFNMIEPSSLRAPQQRSELRLYGKTISSFEIQERISI